MSIPTKQLGEILTEHQVKEVVRIVNGESDPVKRVQKLKDYLGTFSEELEQKGLTTDYLAFAIEFNATGNERLFNKIVEMVHSQANN
jgi:hypothetical protein